MGAFFNGQCYADLAGASGAALSQSFPRVTGSGSVQTAQLLVDGSWRVSTVDAAGAEVVATYPVTFPPCVASEAYTDALALFGLLICAAAVVWAVRTFVLKLVTPL